MRTRNINSVRRNKKTVKLLVSEVSFEAPIPIKQFVPKNPTFSQTRLQSSDHLVQIWYHQRAI